MKVSRRREETVYDGVEERGRQFEMKVRKGDRKKGRKEGRETERKEGRNEDMI